MWILSWDNWWSVNDYSVLGNPAYDDWRDMYSCPSFTYGETNTWTLLDPFWGSDGKVQLVIESYQNVVAETYLPATNIYVTNQVSGVISYNYTDFFGAQVGEARLHINHSLLEQIDEEVYTILPVWDWGDDEWYSRNNNWAVYDENVVWKDYLETPDATGTNFPQSIPRQTYVNIFATNSIGEIHGVHTNAFGYIDRGLYWYGTTFGSNVVYDIGGARKTKDGWKHFNLASTEFVNEWWWWWSENENSPIDAWNKINSNLVARLVYIPYGDNPTPSGGINVTGVVAGADWVTSLTNYNYNLDNATTTVVTYLEFDNDCDDQLMGITWSDINDSVGNTGDLFVIRYVVDAPLYTQSGAHSERYANLSKKIEEWQIVLSNLVWYVPSSSWYDYEAYEGYAGTATTPDIPVSSVYEHSSYSWSSGWEGENNWSDLSSLTTAPRGYTVSVHNPRDYSWSSSARAYNAGNFPRAGTPLSVHEREYTPTMEVYLQEALAYTNTTDLGTLRDYDGQGVMDTGRTELNTWAMKSSTYTSKAYTNWVYGSGRRGTWSKGTGYAFFGDWLGWERLRHISAPRPVDDEMSAYSHQEIKGFGAGGYNMHTVLKFDNAGGFEHFGAE
jgi:hypothetical protein